MNQNVARLFGRLWVIREEVVGVTQRHHSFRTVFFRYLLDHLHIPYLAQILLSHDPMDVTKTQTIFSSIFADKVKIRWYLYYQYPVLKYTVFYYLGFGYRVIAWPVLGYPVFNSTVELMDLITKLNKKHLIFNARNICSYVNLEKFKIYFLFVPQNCFIGLVLFAWVGKDVWLRLVA